MVPEEGREVDFAALESAVRERLAGYKTPKVWKTVDELPKNTNGKILKRVLRDKYVS